MLATLLAAVTAVALPAPVYVAPGCGDDLTVTHVGNENLCVRTDRITA